MIDNTIVAIREVISKIKESRSEDISIKRSLCKEAKIFLSCRSFSMLDYLSFAEDLKSFPVLDLSDIPDNKNREDAIRDHVADHAAALQKYVDKLLKTHIVPYEKIKLNSKRTYGDEVDNLILLFWRVPALLSYAPILTLLALLKGIPRKVFTEEYLTYIDPEKSKISKKEFCAAMTLILNDWYPAQNSQSEQKTDLHGKLDYRSTRYRNKKPFYDHKTLQEDFWMMIFFLVLQKELTKYLISKRRKKNPDFDLSAFYEDFLSLWPYSPKLFLAIEKDQIKTVDEWNSMLKYFFKSAKPYKKFWKFDKIVKAESFCEIHENPPLMHTVSFNSKECFVFSPSRTATNWLMPGTVYFAAYYFIDDMKVYGMLHHKELGAEYKKQILNLLFNIRSSWDWVYDEERSLIADSPYLSEILPFTWEKTAHFDTISRDIWSETKIQKEIDYIYWNILLGIFHVITQEHFSDPPPIKVTRINCEKNKITVLPLRIAQDLDLKKSRHKT